MTTPDDPNSPQEPDEAAPPPPAPPSYPPAPAPPADPGTDPPPPAYPGAPPPPPTYGVPAPPPAYPGAPGPPPAYGTPPSYGTPPPYGTVPGYPQPPYGYPQPPYGAPTPGPSPDQVAPMGLRLVARIIDGVLIAVLWAILIAIFGIHAFHETTTINADGTTTKSFGGGLYSGAYFASIGVAIILSCLYEVGMIAVKGATLGKMAVGVKVVRADTAQVLGWGPAFVRWVIPAAASVACWLLTLLIWLSPLFDSAHRNQGWHDKAAGDFVIRSR